MKDNLKVLAVVSVLVLSVVLVYIFIIIPKDNQKHLRQCLNDQHAVYLEQWNNHCKAIGKEDNCQLPGYTSSEYENQRKERENTCFRLWE